MGEVIVAGDEDPTEPMRESAATLPEVAGGTACNQTWLRESYDLTCKPGAKGKAKTGGKKKTGKR